jgi:WXXGXW repeat (2 copies)
MKRTMIALMISAALAGSVLAFPMSASAQVSVGVSVNFGPPPLPVYPQPYAPGVGYIWTPGYWGYGPYGYYWVPGTWVLAPAIGLLWTPGWWGWEAGFYRWHPGYWGPHVGYYGGINYGYGYTGRGYEGGYWHGRHFYYNRAANNMNPAYARYAYDKPVNNYAGASRVSYNGGEGGVRVQPTAEQEAYARERHSYATAAQVKQEHLAQNNPAQRYSVNHGSPEIAATARPGKFSGSGVVRVNKEHGSYVYEPGKQKITNSRTGARSNQETRPMENPRPDEHMNRNEMRGGEEPGMQPANHYEKPPNTHEPRHAEPPQAKHPPKQKKPKEDRPPPR